MRKHIRLHIPEPCHESWDSMTVVDKGRFCGACQKQVIDFSGMSDQQLIAFFKQPATPSVCGRFMQDQLERNINLPTKRIPWMKYFFGFALPAFLASSKVSAQGGVSVVRNNTVNVPQPSPKTKEKAVAAILSEREKKIKGKVVDDKGEGIPYASVFIKGTGNGVSADSTGDFALKYPGQERNVVLVSSCTGFKEAETLVDLSKTDGPVTALLSPDNMLKEVVVVANPSITGGFKVGGMYTRITYTSFADTLWSKIFPAKQLSNVYPNPVKSNTELTVEVVKSVEGTLLFQLTAANGQIVLSKEYVIDKNNRVIKLVVPPVGSGVYFLNMINKKSGKKSAGKIMIE